MTYQQFISSLATDANLTESSKLNRLRYWRNSELVATDWAMTSDAPTDKSAWAAYRQELRDLPSNIQDIDNPSIPARPGL